MKKTKSLFQQLHEANQQNQELQRQVFEQDDVIETEHKKLLELQSQYTQLKEAADEMAEDLIKQSEFLDGYPESVEKYKSIINK